NVALEIRLSGYQTSDTDRLTYHLLDIVNKCGQHWQKIFIYRGELSKQCTGKWEKMSWRRVLGWYPFLTTLIGIHNPKA
ncbi:hypothetical protein LTR47_011568, partial [Exophiala xenobiotica]